MSSSPDRPSSVRPRIAIVTVLYNSADVLPAFLNSLEQQSTKDWLLIAVDNNSSDDSVRMVDAWRGGPVEIIHNDTNAGFAVATNQGILLARAKGFDAVLMLNNDTEFSANFVAELADQMIDAAAPVLAPVVLYHGQPDRAWFAGGRFTWTRGPYQAHHIERIPPGDAAQWPTEFASGCALLVAMSVFDRIGLLDEQYFVYWEDADFCMRCRHAGIPMIVLRHPQVLHHVSVLTGGESSPFSIRMYHRNQIRFLRKHQGMILTWAQAPVMIAKAAFRLATGREPWSATRLRLATIAATLVESKVMPIEHHGLGGNDQASTA